MTVSVIGVNTYVAPLISVSNILFFYLLYIEYMNYFTAISIVVDQEALGAVL